MRIIPSLLTRKQGQKLHWWYRGGDRGGNIIGTFKSLSSGTVLESFESPVISGTGTTMSVVSDLTWTGGSIANNTSLESSPSNTTEGANSLKVNSTSEQFASYVQTLGNTSIDLTGYDTVEIDITVESMGYASGNVLFGVQDAGASQSASDQTPNGSTGSYTLTCDISGFTDKTALFFVANTTVESGVTHDYVWYIDNLRAS